MMKKCNVFRHLWIVSMGVGRWQWGLGAQLNFEI